MNILILCTGNSCRSQMAHGWISYFTKELDVFSAGTKPEEKVNTFAIKAMDSFGVDISTYSTNNVKEYESHNFDLVLTVCDKAKETCPVVFNTLEMKHKSFPDPVDYVGTDEEKVQHYIEVAVDLKKWIYEILIEKGLIIDN